MNKRRGEGSVPAPSPSPLREKLTRKCSLGCPILDSFLKGGIPCGSITELVGECGSAKTQICLQLLLSAQMPLCQGGLQGSSVYIYTESYFPSRRLQQLARGFVDAGKLGLGLEFAQQKDFPLRRAQEAAAIDCVMPQPNFKFSPHRNYDSIENPDLSYAALSNSRAQEGAVGAANLQKDRNHVLSDNHDSLPVNGGVSSFSDYTDELNPHKNPKKSLIIADAVLSNKQGNGETSYVHGKLESSDDPCDNIFVQSIQNVKELCVFLDQMHVLLTRPLAMPVKLLIIDSVAALFRSDFDNNARDLAMRMEWFFKLSSKLKQYAHLYDIAVLVTNQVVDHVEQESSVKQNTADAMLSGNCPALLSAGRRVIPALGIGWSHCINTRLFLSRTYELDRHPSYHQHCQSLVSSKSISCRGDIHSYDAKMGYGRIASKPNISVLQQLESELPDDLLLTVSHQKSAESCEAFDDDKSLSYCRNAVKVDKEMGQSNLQEMPLSRHEWSMDTEKNHASCRVKRTLQVVFAPNLPALSCEFVVKATQVCGVSALHPQAVYTCYETAI